MRQFRASTPSSSPSRALLAICSQGCTKWTEVLRRRIWSPSPQDGPPHADGGRQEGDREEPDRRGRQHRLEVPEPGSVHVSQVAWIEARGWIRGHRFLRPGGRHLHSGQTLATSEALPHGDPTTRAAQPAIVSAISRITSASVLPDRSAL